MMVKGMLIGVSVAAALGVVAGRAAISAQDKYTVKVPNGLAFSEVRGYEDWSAIAISEDGGQIAVILGNPVIIAAYRDGVPGNGKPFPDGSKMVKIHWLPERNETEPGQPTVPGNLANVHAMVKDSKRFADSGGWGWAAFEYDTASATFRPRTAAENPPQGHDAKCGFACHTVAKNGDYVFTHYGKR
jgi:hypothetical protein